MAAATKSGNTANLFKHPKQRLSSARSVSLYEMFKLYDSYLVALCVSGQLPKEMSKSLFFLNYILSSIIFVKEKGGRKKTTVKIVNRICLFFVQSQWKEDSRRVM